MPTLFFITLGLVGIGRASCLRIPIAARDPSSWSACTSTRRPHYSCSRPVFTARVCVQGMLFATAECCKTPVELIRLYIHEASILLVFTAHVRGPCVRPGHAVCDGRVLQDAGGAGPPVHPRGVHTTRVHGPCSRSVCVQGMLFATAECCKTPVELVRLYIHEA